MLLEWWIARRERLMRAAIGLMAVAAVVWLSYQSWRLLFQQGWWGAIDLRVADHLVDGWFAGLPVYSELDVALYPPASYAMLWPFERAVWAVMLSRSGAQAKHLPVRHEEILRSAALRSG